MRYHNFFQLVIAPNDVLLTKTRDTVIIVEKPNAGNATHTLLIGGEINT